MRKVKLIVPLMLLMGLSSCGSSSIVSVSSASSAAVVSSTSVTSTGASQGGRSGGGPGGMGGSAASIAKTGTYVIDGAKWSYNSSNDVYYQVGINTCVNPANTSYESMGIFVPGSYFTATANSDGNTYTCVVNTAGAKGNYTAATAPIVWPVNTPGYHGQTAPGSYSSACSTYTDEGFIYVLAGMRGTDVTDGEAPWGVTDMKAAIRTYRYNKALLPGADDQMYTFGMSGGGAQSALVGSTGDSDLYTPYLTSLQAPLKDASGNALSDAVAGSMCWCPITSLDVGNEAYEWNMGQFSTDTATLRGTGTWTKALSDDLAAAFASKINAMDLKNGEAALTLEASSSGQYLSGTYYDYILSVISESLTNYLTDTYGTDATSKASYVSSLGSWASFDSTTGTATVNDLGGFVKSQKTATKSVGAFDSLDKSATENTVFRTVSASGSGLHFDSNTYQALADNKAALSAISGYTDYTSDFAADLASTDATGISMEQRTNMYNPMYYLSSSYAGYKTSTVAKHWRIRTGIKQGDTALTTETNLALALKAFSGVSDVDFATVWGLAHTEAERTGTASSNFIAWVKSCSAA